MIPTCKEIGLSPCGNCARSTVGGGGQIYAYKCWIGTYSRNIKQCKDRTIKEQLTDVLVYGHPEYARIVVKTEYPEFLDWFNMMMVLA